MQHNPQGRNVMRLDELMDDPFGVLHKAILLTQ